MIKWLKLPGNQYLGFWILGLVLFFLQEVPYMVMPLLHLETNPIMNMQELSTVLDLWEKVLGSSCIAMMIFILHEEAAFFSIQPGRERLFFCVTVGILLINWFGWVLYFIGYQSIPVMMLFIVMLPPLYYVAIGLWRNNIILSITGCIFLIVHFVHVLGNLRLG